jgi:hypothetical protein
MLIYKGKTEIFTKDKYYDTLISKYSELIMTSTNGTNLYGFAKTSLCDMRDFQNHFYTNQELRKMKLEKLNYEQFRH